jgi:hypothetical protein
MMIVNKELCMSGWIFSGFMTLWVMSIMEMIGLLDSNINVPMSNCMMLGGGLYICYRQYTPTEKKMLNTKALMLNNLLSAFSNEIKKAVGDVKPEPPEHPTISLQPFSDDYIKRQVEFLTRMTKETDAIEKNLHSINKQVVCADDGHDYECIKCHADIGTILECDEDDHWFVCKTCDEPVTTPDIKPVVDRGRSRTRDTEWVETPRSRSLDVNYLCRRTDRSRSRDREGDFDCDHKMVIHTVGYDDRYKKCVLCGYEIPF